MYYYMLFLEREDFQALSSLGTGRTHGFSRSGSHGSPHQQPNVNIIQLLFVLFFLFFVVSVQLTCSSLDWSTGALIFLWAEVSHSARYRQMIGLQNGCPWIWCLLVFISQQLFWPSLPSFTGAMRQDFPSEGGFDYCRH